MNPVHRKIIKEAEAIIIKQSTILQQKQRPVESLPMDVGGLRQAVLDMWEDEINNNKDGTDAA